MVLPSPVIEPPPVWRPLYSLTDVEFEFSDEAVLNSFRLNRLAAVEVVRDERQDVRDLYVENYAEWVLRDPREERQGYGWTQLLERGDFVLGDDEADLLTLLGNQEELGFLRTAVACQIHRDSGGGEDERGIGPVE